MQKFPKPLFLGKGHIEQSESKGVQISVYIHFYERSSAGGRVNRPTYDICLKGFDQTPALWMLLYTVQYF
jgi:hypothetical protein